MTQAEISKINPNHYLDCHPLNPLDPLVDFTCNHEIDNQIPFPRFSPASILNGVVTWQRQRSLRGKALDHALEKISIGDLPGKEYAVKYLRRMYYLNFLTKNTFLYLRFLLATNKC